MKKSSRAQPKKEAIQYCLKTFNFERIHKTMEYLDWRWYVDGKYQVPTLVQLILAAQDRLNDAWDKKQIVESGGLRAVYVPGEEVDEDGELEPPGLELMFILTETQSY